MADVVNDCFHSLPCRFMRRPTAWSWKEGLCTHALCRWASWPDSFTFWFFQSGVVKVAFGLWDPPASAWCYRHPPSLLVLDISVTHNWYMFFLSPPPPLRILKALIRERSTFVIHRGEMFLFGNLLERERYVLCNLFSWGQVSRGSQAAG